MKLNRILIAVSLAMIGASLWMAHKAHLNLPPPKVEQITQSAVNSPGSNIVSGGSVEVGKPLTDQDKIALLRAEAKKRHIKWKIFCTKYMHDPEHQFQGWAVQPGDDFKIYSDDGAKPCWDVIGRTQAEVAERLYRVIQDEPTTIPSSRPNSPAESMADQCPQELTSESKADCKLCGASQ